MIEYLIVDFFQKIEENEAITSKNGKANFLIQELLEEKHGKFNYIGVQKATRLQRKYIDKDVNVSAILTDGFLKDVMAQYLNYDNYTDYVNTKDPIIINTINKEINNNDSIIIKLIYFFKKHQKIIIGITIPSLSILFFFSYKNPSIDQDNGVGWEGETHKQMLFFDDDLSDNESLKININLFKKKPDVNLDSEFYINGTATISYGKNNSGFLEYFTTRGQHPENRKELKRISKSFLYQQGLLK